MSFCLFALIQLNMQQLRGVELRRFNRKQPKSPLEVVLVLDQIQYARNVAEIFRIADAVKVKKIIICGRTHKPPFGKDLQKVSRRKEFSMTWEYAEYSTQAIEKLKKEGYLVAAVEITDKAERIEDFISKNTANKIALILGNEVSGLTRDTLAKVDTAVYIPMFGKGASLNVAVSCAV